jgi:FkbM family methyltransferase
MTFISYAQNFEDVMLWRALKHVEKGLYIDVGANDPTVHSVTKAFYDRGWNGINVEPLPSHHADLMIARPRDINLQCAAGAEEGEIEVWECDVRGWGTASPDVISQHSKNGHQGVFHRVTLSPLKNICSKYVSSDIHFLKIDVEGFEKYVIDGMDFSCFRPWIMVIEATKPNSTQEVYSEWEQEVISNGYMLVYTDGLNRFYVAKEHDELLEALRYPPNIFDAFIRVDQLESDLRAQQAEAKIQQVEAQAQQAEAKIQQVEAQAQQVQQELAAIYLSRSWRLTEPMRWVAYRARWFKSGVMAWLVLKPSFRPRRVIRFSLLSLRSWVISRPRVAIRVRWLLTRFPRIKKCLLGFSQANPLVFCVPRYTKDQRPDFLSRVQIPRDSLIPMSFLGTELSHRFSSGARLPDYIADWWRSQQTSNIGGLTRYGDIGHADSLLSPSGAERLRILQMTTYEIDKPDHGGKLRCHHIRRALRTRFEVQTLSFEWGEKTNTSTKSVILDKRKWGGLGIDGVSSDWGIVTYLNNDPVCYSQIANLVREYNPDAIVMEQPFLWRLVERFLQDGSIHQDIKLIYSSQNIEVNMKRVIYQNYYLADVAAKYIAHVDEIEKDVIRACSAVITVSSQDAMYVADVFPHKLVRVFANGHSKLGATFEDEKWRALFAAQNRNWVFVGSWHSPNIHGLRDLLAALKLLDDGMEDSALWVLGSAGNGFVLENVDFHQDDYPWLHILGPVSGEDIESAIMCSSGVVLPIWEGGGSNLKTAQALLSGKCVLGSEFSFRGFEHCANEAGVSLVPDAEGLARLVVNTQPQENYPRSDSVSALAWESILETLPAFVHDVVIQDARVS